MITTKQKQLLELIKNTIRKDGVPPSYDEMKDALGLASKSGIHRMITALEERGYIRRLPNKARAIELTEKTSVQFFDGSDSHALLAAVCSLEGASEFVPEALKKEINDYYKRYSESNAKRLETVL